MRRIAILGTDLIARKHVRRALEELQAIVIDDAHEADALIACGMLGQDALGNATSETSARPLLCNPMLDPPANATVASHLRFMEGSLQARHLIAASALGTPLTFRAQWGKRRLEQFSDPAFWKRCPESTGALLDSGVDILDLLCFWLGPLTVEASEGDGAGGIEAEFQGRFRSDLASGDVLISWLRDLPPHIHMQGPKGWLRVDLDSFRITSSLRQFQDQVSSAKPPSLKTLHAGRVAAWLRPDSQKEALLADSGVSSLLRECRSRLVRLRHPWEAPAWPANPGLHGKRVVVTGANGFIGARLTERLCECGAQVTAIVRSPHRAARVARLGARILFADLTNADAVRAAVEDSEIAFSLAHDFHGSVEANVSAFTLLADSCHAAGVNRIVHVSSIAAYDDWPVADLDESSPASLSGHAYKQTKVAIDTEIERRSGLGQFTSVILRPTIVYGPFSRFWTDDPAERLMAGPTEIPAGFAGRCNGVYVDDVVESMLAAALAKVTSSEVFIVSGPSPFPWKDLFLCYADAMGSTLTLSNEAPPAMGHGQQTGRAPAHQASLSGLAGLAIRRATIVARRILGARRFEALQDYVTRVRRARGGIYRPVASNPALFCSTATCSIEKLKTRLREPQVASETGLALSARYLKWKYGPMPDQKDAVASADRSRNSASC